MEAFFAWAELEFDAVRDQRSSIRSALGYSVRQKDALLRVLDDGRLLLDNNRSERALRGTIATGRKAWLFVGSDDHAESAGHIFSLIASCRLHGLDPEAYLRDLFRVLAHWPRDRYLELAPKYWATTRVAPRPRAAPVRVRTPPRTAADRHHGDRTARRDELRGLTSARRGPRREFDAVTPAARDGARAADTYVQRLG